MGKSLILRIGCAVFAAALVYTAAPRLYGIVVLDGVAAETDTLQTRLNVYDIYLAQTKKLDAIAAVLPDDPELALLWLTLVSQAERFTDDVDLSADLQQGFVDLLSAVPGNPDYWALYALRSSEPAEIAAALNMSLRQGLYDPSAALQRLKVAARSWEELPPDLQAQMSQQIGYLWEIREKSSVASVFLLARPVMRGMIVASIPQTYGQQKKLARLTGDISILATEPDS